MKKETDIQNELIGISELLASISRENVYSVPADYFSDLSRKIELHVLLQDSKIKNTNPVNTPVPPGYFENFSDAVLAKIKVEESEEEETNRHSSLPDTLKHLQPYKVPSGYFDALSGQILLKTEELQRPKVVKMQRSGLWKLLAAAVVSGIILITSIYLLNTPGTKQNDFFARSEKYSNPARFEEGIASLQDEEIIHYLQSHSSFADNEVLIRYINPENLPEETDYLLDENTLADFLNKLN